MPSPELKFRILRTGPGIVAWYFFVSLLMAVFTLLSFDGNTSITHYFRAITTDVFHPAWTIGGQSGHFDLYRLMRHRGLISRGSMSNRIFFNHSIDFLFSTRLRIVTRHTCLCVATGQLKGARQFGHQ